MLTSAGVGESVGAEAVTAVNEDCSDAVSVLGADPSSSTSTLQNIIYNNLNSLPLIN